MRHPDIGRKMLDEIAEVLKGSAIIERNPMMEGRMMSMIVSRAPGWEPPKKETPPPGKPKGPAKPSDSLQTPVPIPESSDTSSTTEES